MLARSVFILCVVSVLALGCAGSAKQINHLHVGMTKADVINAMGEPIFERIARAGHKVAAFRTTLVSKSPLIEAFALALETGNLTLLPDEAGRAELEAYERRVTETGISKYAAPEGMHDDTVIARALMYRAMGEAATRVPRNQEHSRQVMEALSRL